MRCSGRPAFLPHAPLLRTDSTGFFQDRLEEPTGIEGEGGKGGERREEEEGEREREIVL